MHTYKTNKNGLIELIRFVCSVWVAYFHGFFPVISDKFNGIILPVDIFFVISGYFFLKSIEKYREKPFLRGVHFIFYGRTKRFIVPLIIAASSVLLCNLFFKLDLGFNWPLSFLWFFAAQFVFLSFFYLLLKIIKRRLTFNIFCVVIILISMSLFRLNIKPLDICFRGPGMIALGILVSQAPKLMKKANPKLSLTVNVIGFAICAITSVYLAYLPGYALWRIHLLCCVVFPLLIYFASKIPLYSKFLNLLGELSVFVYLAQCPILLHHYFVSKNTKDQFVWLCICAAALFLINRIINRKKTLIKQ